MDSCTNNIREGNSYYQRIVDWGFRILGKQTAKVYEADSQNACAVPLPNGGAIITYDPYFLEYLEDQNPNFAIIVLIHEVSHIHQCHVGCRRISARGKTAELEADNVSGWISRHMKMNLADSIKMFELPEFKYGGKDHPEGWRRKEAFTEGWRRADRRLNPEKYQKKQEDLTIGLLVAGISLLVIGIGAAISSR